jgi:hypothetical protein
VHVFLYEIPLKSVTLIIFLLLDLNLELGPYEAAYLGGYEGV